MCYKMKIIDCDKLDNAPVGLSDISDDDDLYNVHIDLMIKNQWYKFDNQEGITVYLKLENDMTLIQTMEKPTKC